MKVLSKVVSYCLLVCSLLPTGVLAEEELNYLVSYRGVFSVGARIPIADVSLVTRSPGADAGYRETEMGVTSQPYAAVEAFYPIRYRFRSWYLEDHSTCVAAEYFERNRRSGVKHRLIYLDDPQQPFVIHNLLTDGQGDLEALQDGSYRAGHPLPSQAGRFDRLGLLQRVRGAALVPGMHIEAQVTNGKTMLRYQAKVEARERIEVAGRTWNALKLRFDGYKKDGHGKDRHAHRPVFIWFSDDPRHIPLRAVSRHVLGRFSIELKHPPVLLQLAKRDSG